MIVGDEQLKNWMPIRGFMTEQGPMLDWCFMGERRFTEPFTEVTVGSLLQTPFNLLFRPITPIEELGEILERHPHLTPDGFIFHMSRCGSTLISQMLAASERNIMISEAQPIDAVLRANVHSPSVTDEQRTEWLRLTLGALGRRRQENESRFFIKFDSWGMLDIDIVLRAFPDTPWIFLYRDPVEVMASQLRSPGSQMIRGAVGRSLPGFSQVEMIRMSGEEYCARVLARFCEAALAYAGNEKGMLVNYSELPDAVTGRISKHFGVTFTDEEIEKILGAAHRDAKTPSLTFEPDGEAKRAFANDSARSEADKWLYPLYNRLEEKRAAKW